MTILLFVYKKEICKSKVNISCHDFPLSYILNVVLRRVRKKHKTNMTTDHAKVSKFDPPTGRVTQKNVLWFEVSVDETERVQVGQSTAELGHHPLTTVLLHADLGGEVSRGLCELKGIF